MVEVIVYWLLSMSIVDFNGYSLDNFYFETRYPSREACVESAIARTEMAREDFNYPDDIKIYTYCTRVEEPQYGVYD